MKFKIKQIIFTDTTKAGKEQIDKSGNKFWMLHLEVIPVGKDSFISPNEFWQWIWKYYTVDRWDKLKSLIKVWEIYDIIYSQKWPWKTIETLSDDKWNLIIKK